MVRPRARGIKPGPFAWMTEGSCACGGTPTVGVLGPAFMDIGERCVRLPIFNGWIGRQPRSYLGGSPEMICASTLTICVWARGPANSSPGSFLVHLAPLRPAVLTRRRKSVATAKHALRLDLPVGRGEQSRPVSGARFASSVLAMMPPSTKSRSSGESRPTSLAFHQSVIAVS